MKIAKQVGDWAGGICLGFITAYLGYNIIMAFLTGYDLLKG